MPFILIPDVTIPETIEVHFVGHNLNRIRNTVSTVLKECKKRGEKVAFHLHAQTSGLLFLSSTAFMRIHRQTLFTVHSLCSARHLKYRLGSYACALLANYVSCISNAVYNDYWKLVRFIKRDRMRVMVNAIDFKRLEDAIADMPPHYDIADMHKLVCVDRLIPLKNQQFIVKLMKYLPDCRLIIIGTDESGGDIKEIIKQEGIEDRVVFSGLLPREEVYREMNKCGIYVTASKIEGLHNSVLEAMGLGVIPVISNIPAHREIAEAIGLYKPVDFDNKQWVETIRMYQSMDIEDAIQLSNKLIDKVKEKFSLYEMHKKFNNVYLAIAK